MSFQSDFKKFDFNIDRLLIFVLPIALLSILFWMPYHLIVQSSVLVISIFFYVTLTYKNRLIYGFSGIRIASIPSIIIATFTVFIALPSINVLAMMDHPGETPYFCSIILFYVLFPAGLLIGSKYRCINLNKVNLLLVGTSHKEKYDKYFYEILVIIFSFAILIFTGYLLRVNEIPLLELLKNPGDTIKFFFMREEALKILKMTRIERYMFHWLRSLLIPFGIIGSLFLSLVYKRRKYILLFILFLFLGLVVNTITIEKSPIASIFLSIGAYIFLTRNRINPTLIIAIIVVILLGPVLITYFIFLGREDILNVILLSYFDRLIIKPTEILFYYFKYFPSTHEFLLGRSSQLFSWLHIDGTFPLSNYVARLWWDSPHTTGLANANYLGNYWADFGWYGIIVSTFSFGIICHLLQWKILETTNYKKNIIYLIVMTVSVPIFTFGFFSSNFTILFFTKGLILLVFFLICYDYWQKHSTGKVTE